MTASMILPRPMPPFENKETNLVNTGIGQMERPRKFNRLRATPLRRTSDKMRKQLVEYSKVKLIWWAARLEIDGGRCQFTDEAGNRCPKQASRSPHHVYGRGKYLCDPST